MRSRGCGRFHQLSTLWIWLDDVDDMDDGHHAQVWPIRLSGTEVVCWLLAVAGLRRAGVQCVVPMRLSGVLAGGDLLRVAPGFVFLGGLLRADVLKAIGARLHLARGVPMWACLVYARDMS